MAASLWLLRAVRVAGHRDLGRWIEMLCIAEFFALIGVVVLLRVRMARLVDRLSTDHDLLFAQNKALAQQNIDLERQTLILNDQSTELEEQSKIVEHRTRELEVLTRRLGEAQHVAKLGYWEIDSKTGDVFWSDEMYRLAGLEVGIRPAPTDRYMEVVYPDDRERMQRVAAEAIESLTEFTQLYRMRNLVNPTGGLRTVQSTGRIVIDDRGDRKLVGTVQDVTERVQLESQLRRSQKMEALGQLAGGVAHDFNNVLTVIEAYAALALADASASGEVKVDVREIRDAGRRAASLTRQLLAFSRQQVLQPRVINLNSAIGDVEKMLRRLIGEHIEFRTLLADDLDPVKADLTQIEQVFVNLAVNARDAMPDGGTLTIETANVVLDTTFAQRRATHKPGAYVMLAVSDTGCGIPPENLERIFEPFFTTKETGKGTGLGLATVHGIVEQSEGHVWVYSEVGQGTTFKVYLPRADVSEVEASSTLPPLPPPAGNETILLVEDDVALRTVVQAVLRRAGFEVITAVNGVDALAIIKRTATRIDIVVSDMVMPEMGGRALATEMDDLRPGVPILLMSGYRRDALSRTPEAGVGRPFIEKPFTPTAFVAKIREVLDGRHAL